MKRNSKVAAPTATSRQGRARNCFLLAAAAVTTLAASVSWAAPAGAAASITAAYDPETCDLVVSGTGFSEADLLGDTALGIRLVNSSNPVQGAYYPWVYTRVLADEVLDDGNFDVTIPSMVEFVADAPPLVSVSPDDTDGGTPLTATPPVSPCVSQDVSLEAQGTVIGAGSSIQAVSSEKVLRFWATVDGFPCRFDAPVEFDADFLAAIASDSVAGVCVAPSGHSLIGSQGVIDFVSPPIGRPTVYQVPLLDPVDLTAIDCADGTCLVLSEILAGQVARTTTTTTAPTTTSTTTSTTTPAVVTTTTAAPGGVVKPRFTG